MHIVRVSRENWQKISAEVHLIVFDEKKVAEDDRIDFALVCENEHGLPLGYVTCRETHKETLYWQYGGMFPGTRGTTTSLRVTEAFREWSQEHYKRVFFYVENTNKAMLKMAMSIGFLITGIRNYQGFVLVEHLLEFK